MHEKQNGFIENQKQRHGKRAALKRQNMPSFVCLTAHEFLVGHLILGTAAISA